MVYLITFYFIYFDSLEFYIKNCNASDFHQVDQRRKGGQAMPSQGTAQDAADNSAVESPFYILTVRQ